MLLCPRVLTAGRMCTSKIFHYWRWGWGLRRFFFRVDTTVVLFSIDEVKGMKEVWNVYKDEVVE